MYVLYACKVLADRPASSPALCAWQAQLEALQAALSQEVALIQGPPATGKVSKQPGGVHVSRQKNDGLTTPRLS